MFWALNPRNPRILGIRDVDLRVEAGGRTLSQNVTGDTDDRQPWLFTAPATHFQTLSDGVLSGPALMSQLFADNDDSLRGLCIRFSERTSFP